LDGKVYRFWIIPVFSAPKPCHIVNEYFDGGQFSFEPG
jgi:hypothetical protein